MRLIHTVFSNSSTSVIGTVCSSFFFFFTSPHPFRSKVLHFALCYWGWMDSEWRSLTCSLSVAAGRRRQGHTFHKWLWLQNFPTSAWTEITRCEILKVTTRQIIWIPFISYLKIPVLQSRTTDLLKPATIYKLDRSQEIINNYLHIENKVHSYLNHKYLMQNRALTRWTD